MPRSPHLRWQLPAASAAIYLFWGAAYLAMKTALGAIPPLLLAGGRLLAAGSLMSAFGWARGFRVQAAHWRALLISSALLFLGGHGLLYWGQQRVSSGLAAVLFSTIPLFVVLIEGCSPHGIRLSSRVWTGLALGLTGVIVLVGPDRVLGSGQVDFAGASAITLASLSWAAGTFYCSRAHLPASGAIAGGLEMLCGGTFLVIAAAVSGELHGFTWRVIPPSAWWAIAFLVGCSSMIGFACFLWLLRHASPARVATYAYVTPLVALTLGWGWAGEVISRRDLVAAALLLAAVVLIVRSQTRAPSPCLAPELESQAAISG